MMLMMVVVVVCFFSARPPPPPPSGPGPPHTRGFYIKHKDAPQSVGLLWTSDQPVAETCTRQHTTHTQGTGIHVPGGIRTDNRSRRAAVDPCLRSRGHQDRLLILLLVVVVKTLSYILTNYSLLIKTWN